MKVDQAQELQDGKWGRVFSGWILVKGFGAESLITWNPSITPHVYHLLLEFTAKVLVWQENSKHSLTHNLTQLFGIFPFFLTYQGKILYKADLLLKGKKKVHLSWSEVLGGLIKKSLLTAEVSAGSLQWKHRVSQFLWTKALYLTVDVPRSPNDTWEVLGISWPNQRCPRALPK